ncbi:MAG: PAS domain S-box protein [Gemmatimonadota bacterium]|jgi:PAS domain S-box-containing protein
MSDSNHDRRELRTLLASSPDPIFISTVEGRLVEVNRACRELFGIGEDALEELSAVDFYVDPDDRDRFRETLEAEGSVTRWEVELKSTSGRTFLGRIDAAVRLDDGGNPTGIMGFVRDATRENEARAALVEAEQRYRSLVGHNPYPVYGFDLEGHFVEANAAVERLLGYSLDQILGMPFLHIIAPDDRERAEEIFSRTLAGEPQTYELEVVHRDGRHLVIEGVSIPILGTAGVVGIHGVARNVTAQRRAQAELREQWASYRTLFDSVTEGIYIHAPDGRFVDVNEAAAAMFGYTRDEIIGETPAFISCTDRVDLDLAMEHVSRALAGEPRYFSWWGRRKDGECFPMEVSLSRGRYFGRDVVIAVTRDVTETRRMERQLRQAQKMEAVGRLAGGVAHDFNNVLTAIQGHCELAIEDVRPADPVRKDLEEIRANADRAARLTRQLLAFSRRQMLHPEVLDPAVVLAEVKAMLARLIGEHIELSFDIDDGLWPVEVDRAQLEQVVMNLALNARDAMPSGGRLEVTLDNHVLTPEAATARPYEIRPGRWVRLCVSDTGAGMDAETVRHIFEPFFTTKDQGDGTGLGLATVYGIVKQSGGFIEVDSVPGRGTSFELLLPAVGSEVSRPPDAGDERGGPRIELATATVLIVEDEAAVRSLGRRILERHGYRVLEAAHAQEALRMVEGETGTIDLLLTDLVMPGMSGRELIERLQHERPQLRALAMSGYSDDEVGRAPGQAKLPFLEKPFTPNALVAKVREILE